jgi:hypothetical protein
LSHFSTVELVVLPIELLVHGGAVIHSLAPTAYLIGRCLAYLTSLWRWFHVGVHLVMTDHNLCEILIVITFFLEHKCIGEVSNVFPLVIRDSEFTYALTSNFLKIPVFPVQNVVEKDDTLSECGRGKVFTNEHFYVLCPTII